MAGTHLTEPFGVPDGGIGNIERFEADFVSMPTYYGGIARALDDASVRVVAGRMGAGKSLYLRMMRSAQQANGSVFAEQPTRNLSDLSTADIIQFSRIAGTTGANSEAWKLLWRRAIFRAAASYVLTERLIMSSVPPEALNAVARMSKLLGSPQTKRRVTTEAKNILLEHHGRAEVHKYLNHGDWPDAENLVLDAISHARPLFLYVDAIDDNFKWAPSYWMSCQRGLYYAIMDLLRGGEGENRIHVVIALRDIVLGSTRASEHAPRYLDETHINILGWTHESISEFLQYKLKKIPAAFFERPSDRTLSSWLSLDTIRNSRPNPSVEPIGEYLVRHTRGVPRDIVVLGNRLSRYVRACRMRGDEISEDGIRLEVSRASREFAASQLAQCANQVMSDSMPGNAVDQDYVHVYLEPNEYQMTDAVEAICSCIRTVGNEEFDVSGKSTLDDMASDAFGTSVNLADILWQNGLIGWVGRGGAAHFYSLEDIASTALPKADRYVFRSILFDRIRELKASSYPVRRYLY